jgi:hypothetical protein
MFQKSAINQGAVEEQSEEGDDKKMVYVEDLRTQIKMTQHAFHIGDKSLKTFTSQQDLEDIEGELRLSEIQILEDCKDDDSKGPGCSECDEGYIGGRSQAVVEEVVAESEKEYKTIIGHLLLAPTFLRDNEYIKLGYRINFNTKRKILRSLFLLHNETVNVWSHLLGVIVFIGFLIWSIVGLYASSTYRELMTNQEHFSRSQLSREELTLMNHSSAGEMYDFEQICQSFLNKSISTGLA